MSPMRQHLAVGLLPPSPHLPRSPPLTAPLRLPTSSPRNQQSASYQELSSPLRPVTSEPPYGTVLALPTKPVREHISPQLHRRQPFNPRAHPSLHQHPLQPPIRFMTLRLYPRPHQPIYRRLLPSSSHYPSLTSPSHLRSLLLFRLRFQSRLPPLRSTIHLVRLVSLRNHPAPRVSNLSCRVQPLSHPYAPLSGPVQLQLRRHRLYLLNRCLGLSLARGHVLPVLHRQLLGLPRLRPSMTRRVAVFSRVSSVQLERRPVAWTTTANWACSIQRRHSGR